jgi:hypothetical protein
MSIMKQNEKAKKYEQIVYDLKGITYVPHYRNNSIFVGPGYPRHTNTRYSDVELMMLGAKPRAEFLWSRGTTGEVSDRNP